MALLVLLLVFVVWVFHLHEASGVAVKAATEERAPQVRQVVSVFHHTNQIRRSRTLTERSVLIEIKHGGGERQLQNFSRYERLVD